MNAEAVNLEFPSGNRVLVCKKYIDRLEYVSALIKDRRYS